MIKLCDNIYFENIPRFINNYLMSDFIKPCCQHCKKEFNYIKNKPFVLKVCKNVICLECKDASSQGGLDLEYEYENIRCPICLKI